MSAMCRCGHPRATHTHYRPGDDCGACGPAVCPRYQPPRTLLARAAWSVRFLADLARDIGRAPRH